MLSETLESLLNAIARALLTEHDRTAKNWWIHVYFVIVTRCLQTRLVS